APPRLVVRAPAARRVAEPPGARLGVLDERLGRRAHRPTAFVLERLWRVPVEEGRERLDPVREQLVDEAGVEIEPRPTDPAAALPPHPPPSKPETGPAPAPPPPQPSARPERRVA